MIAEHEMVALEKDVPEHLLREGDVGTIVHVFEEDAGYMVEFNTSDGDAVAILDLKPEQVHWVPRGKLRIYREFAA